MRKIRGRNYRQREPGAAACSIQTYTHAALAAAAVAACNNLRAAISLSPSLPLLKSSILPHLTSSLSCLRLILISVLHSLHPSQSASIACSRTSLPPFPALAVFFLHSCTPLSPCTCGLLGGCLWWRLGRGLVRV